MVCDRCFQHIQDEAQHGLGVCPYEPRPLQVFLKPDSIPGGILIEHGLCNPDGTPRRYDSQSEIDRECKARGLIRWTDMYTEDRTKDARVHDDWLKSGEAKRQRQARVEQRAERRLAQEARR